MSTVFVRSRWLVWKERGNGARPRHLSERVNFTAIAVLRHSSAG
jgi:hypothetical protein